MKSKALNNRIWIKGLVMQCPLGIPVDDCPLNGLRSLPISEANNTINRLSDEKLKAFISTHRQCYNHRLKKTATPVL